MKKALAFSVIAVFIFATMARATLNSLVMKVGQQQATSLVSNVPGSESVVEAYNGINDPQAAITGVLTETALAAISKEAPELYKAYQLISSPSSFIEGTIKSGICDSNKELCNAYDTGMQLKSAVQNPQNAQNIAKQYALQALSKDPKVGGKISQAFMIKGYVDELMAEPTVAREDAAIASKSELPKTSSTGPTAAAIAEPDKPFSDVSPTVDQSLVGSCAIGFTIGKAGTPLVGDIQSCKITSNKPAIDISFAFDQKGIIAKVAGKGCTISKSGTKVYLYNTESCAITVDKWAIPASGKGTYAIFDKIGADNAKAVEMVEGRFVPAGEKQEFKFEDRGYEVPKGGVLYFKNGEFELDLTAAQAKEFSISSYKNGKKIERTTVKQLGDKKVQVKKTPLGFEIIGDAEIENQFNRIKSTGKIEIDSRGILARLKENTDAIVFPSGMKLKGDKDMPTAAKPENGIRIRTKDAPVEFKFSARCQKTQTEGPTVTACTTDKGALRIESKDAEGARTSHVKSYTAKKDIKLSDMMADLKPKANKKLIGRFTKVTCYYNTYLRERDASCGDIKEGEEILMYGPLTSPGKKGNSALQWLDRVLDAESGEIDVSSFMGTRYLLDAEKGSIKLVIGKPMMTIVEIGEPIIEQPTLMLPPMDFTNPGKMVAEDVLGAVTNWPTPDDLEEIDVGNSKIVIDAEKEKAKVCGSRRGGETGKPVSITSMAEAEGGTSTADACSVELVAPKEKPKCEKSAGSLICRIQEPDKQIRFQRGKALPGGRLLCEINIDYSDGRHITYSDIGCKRRVTSNIEGTYGSVEDLVENTRSEASKELTKFMDFEYGGLLELFGR